MRTQNINHALPDGSRIDNYEIIESIGSGGFGITYKAQDTALKHLVAIKEYLPVQLAWRADESTVIPRTDSDTESFEYGLEQFIEEGRTLARFKHSNIVRVIRYFKANGTAYLVMEYEHGQTLKEFLLTHPRPDESILLGFMTSILKGLKAIHDQGFLHRDIKPSNIYLRDEGEPLLIDFGSARQALTRQTQSLTGIVTEGFAPFEQYTGNIQQTPATDLYGLGATLYQALSGGAPMNALDRFNSLHVSNKDPLPPSTQAGATNYNHFFLSLIDWLLEIYPENRPQTVGAVIESLNDQDLPDLNKTRVNTRLHQNIAANQEVHRKPRKLLFWGSLISVLLLANVSYWALMPTQPKTTNQTTPNSTTNSTTASVIPANPFSKKRNGGVRFITELLVVKGGNYFQVESTPSSAKIYINDVFHGTTPYVINKFPKGVYKITIKKTGYISSNRSIYKKQDYSYLFNPTLNKIGEKPVKRYSFNVETSPENTRITFLNSSLKFAEDMQLAKGQYQIKVTAPFHQPLIKNFEIDYADRTLKITLTHNKLLRVQKFANWVERITNISADTAAISVRRNNTQIVNLNTGQITQRFEGSFSSKFGISRTNSQLFTANKGHYKLWGLKQGKKLASIKTSDNFTTSILFLPNGNGWVRANYETNELKFFTFSQYPNASKTLKLRRPIQTIFDFSPDGKFILATDYKNKSDLLIVNIKQQKISAVLKGYDWTIQNAGFTPDGKNIISMTDDGKLRLWSLATKKPVWTSNEKFFAYTTLTISPDGRYAATSSNYNSILIWDLNTGKVIANIAGHTDSIVALAFFSNNTRLASGSHDKTVRIWDISQLLKLREQHTQSQ